METVLMDKNHIFTDDRSLKMPEGFISSDEYEEKLAEEEQTTIQEKAREMYTELKLEQLRRQFRVSQKELAGKMQITQSQVSKIEKKSKFGNKDIKTISKQFRA